MKANLKRIYSSDYDLKSYHPESSTNFVLYLQAFIGPADEDSADAFNIIVCTPIWFAENYITDPVVFGRGYIFVFEYNLEIIEKVIDEFCEKCIGENWMDVAQKVSRIGIWEFEDYKDIM